MLPTPSIEFVVYAFINAAWVRRGSWGTYEAARDEAVEIYGNENKNVIVCDSRLLFSLGVDLL